MKECLTETVRRVVNMSGQRLVEVSATETTKIVSLASPKGDVFMQFSDSEARALAEALMDAASDAV